MVLGATGTGKRVVADSLINDDFELLEPNFDVAVDLDNYSKELTFFMRRLRTQLQAASLKDRRDIVTVRSFYDQHECFQRAMLDQTMITKKDFESFEIIYSNLFDAEKLSEPPDAVVYMKTNKMSALNRQALTGGRDVTQDFFHREIEYYEKFVEKIAVPLIEIDAADKPDKIKNALDFGVSSLKAANLGGKSIWRRSFFR